MATDPVRDLRDKIAALKAMDMAKLRKRAELFGARLDIEDLAGQLSADTDADPEVVLLVIRAAWMTRLEVDTVGEDTPDPDAHRVKVEADTRRILTALAEGQTETGDPFRNRCLQKALTLGQEGKQIISVRQMMERTKCMIGNKV